jgi:hypothetical protein
MPEFLSLLLSGLAVAASGGALAFVVNVAGRLATVEAKLVSGLPERLTKLETVISMMGESAARALHSPHTPELDALLDKYIDNNYELSPAEWGELRQLCVLIEDDKTLARQERMLAGTVKAMCFAALHEPPPAKQHHDA